MNCIGFAMSYGVLQEYFSDNWTLQGEQNLTGVIGTTFNGVIYLSMPFLFAAFSSNRFARWRRQATIAGAVLSCLGFIAASYSTHIWHLVATLGVIAPFGCALVYSPTTLSLGEWFNTSNRSLAYGLVFSCKNVVGSVCPFLFRGLLDHYGFRQSLRIWAVIAAGTSLLATCFISTPPRSLDLASTPRGRTIPWHFLRHRTIWIYSIAIVLQSSGYSIPQTYLNTYAHEVTLLSQASATLLLTLFNVPGILSSSFFGYLADNKHLRLSAATVTSISAISSAIAALLLWGFTAQGSMALLVTFSLTFGFFSGGYSATWGGVINELEKEAADSNEAVDTGVIYGLLNGARGVGYVGGGLAGVPLMKSGAGAVGRFGYDTSYGPLIIFTGLSSIFGGWAIFWKWIRDMNVLA